MEVTDGINCNATVFTIQLGVGKNKWTFAAGGGISYNGTQILGTRASGFTAGTGTPNKGAFAADSATAAQAAQRCLALEQALRTAGIIS